MVLAGDKKVNGDCGRVIPRLLSYSTELRAVRFRRQRLGSGRPVARLRTETGPPLRRTPIGQLLNPKVMFNEGLWWL